MLDFSFPRSDAQLITVISVVAGEVLNICSELSRRIGDCGLFTSECFCRQKQEKRFQNDNSKNLTAICKSDRNTKSISSPL